MAEIKDIKEGAKFLTPKESDGAGRVGITYGVTETLKELGIVKLVFEREGRTEEFLPSTTQMNVKFLTLIK